MGSIKKSLQILNIKTKEGGVKDVYSMEESVKKCPAVWTSYRTGLLSGKRNP